MLDDAVTAIAREGAGYGEVSVRLQKTLAFIGDKTMRPSASYHMLLALELYTIGMGLPKDLKVVQDAPTFN